MNKFCIALLVSSVLLTGCKQQELLQGLDQIQANEVIALLQRNNIQAYKQSRAKEGFVIIVAPEDFTASVDLMNSHGLPRKPDLQIAQMFPSDSLVSSPRAEKARLYSAIEQRLGQSLLALKGVTTARVHVSYDIDGGESSSNKKTIHLSALLNYDSEIKNKELLIGDVKKFLKNSFDNLDYDNISVVISPIEKVQRVSPVIIHKSGPSLELILSVVSGVACIMLLMALLLRTRFSSMASKLKSLEVVARKKADSEASDAENNKNSRAAGTAADVGTNA